MNYDILKLVKKENGSYVVDLAKVVPATIDHIKNCVKGIEDPTDIMTPGWPGRPDREPVADRFMKKAEKIPEQQWALALEKYKAPEEEEMIGAVLDRQTRRYLLEFIESWWMRALTIAGDKPIKVHIQRNLNFKR